MRISIGKAGLVVLTLLVLACVAGLIQRRDPARGLPYAADFSNSAAGQWTAYAGTWETANGAIRNDSTDRGAKLITGSPHWTDYAIDADIQLLGPGDAGILARVSDAETGVDAYTGFYAGVRTMDNALVIGRAEHGWAEFPDVQMRGGIVPFRWYHLRLAVAGCGVRATATAYGSLDTAVAFRTLRNCPSSGMIGLRSYYSGGIWRNVKVRPVQDVAAALPALSGPLPPPENAGLERGLLGDYIPSIQQMTPAKIRPSPASHDIASLRLESPLDHDLRTVRGLVILTQPGLYVQDSTGGVSVRSGATPPLKIGDEVEVTGRAQNRAFGVALEDADVHLLWHASAVPPLSITPNQAATGAYDSMFVQLEGVLRSQSARRDAGVVLGLDHGAQSFRAVLFPGRTASRVATLRTGATLRLRGVCVVASEFTGSTTPFALLVRSAEDIEVVAGPPWWTLSRLIPFAIGTLILAALAGQIYILARHWRLRAVLEERGRLAHELHDTLAQSFAGIGFQLQAVRKALTAEDATALQPLELACDMVRHSHEEARRSIATLRPEALEAMGLGAAIVMCGKRMTQSGAISIRSVVTGTPQFVPLRIKDTLFRIGLEAMANAIRHAEAKVIRVRVDYRKGCVSLAIQDDGKGFDPGSHNPGFGLIGMEKRARSISAALSVESAPQAGTTIEVVAGLPKRFTPSALPGHLWQLLRTKAADAN